MGGYYCLPCVADKQCMHLAALNDHDLLPLRQLACCGLPRGCPPQACLLQDDETQVQWWKLMLCDPEGSWTPGGQEEKDRREKNATSGRDWEKERNMIVR